MANTTTCVGKIVEITGLDVDWVWSTDLPDHLKGCALRRIQLRPSAAGDAIIIRNGSIAGPRAWARDGTYQTLVIGTFTKDAGINPALKISDCTITTPASASIIMEFN